MNRKIAGIVIVAALVVAGIVVAVGTMGGGGEPAPAPGELAVMQPKNGAVDADHAARAQKLINDGIKFLLSKRDEQGGWGQGSVRPAYTAIATMALAQHPSFDKNSPVIREAVEVILSYRQDDGGFYDKQLKNYTTSICLMALTAVGGPELRDDIDGAVRFIKGLQILPGEETADGDVIDEKHPFRGGTSYGEHGRPDLSNLAMSAEAMHAAGVPASDRFWQEAIVFLQRTQKGEKNDLPWVLDTDKDGGFIYAPAIQANKLDQPESKADPVTGRRSYGSMTYAGFKSLLYAGLSKTDPRVEAAFGWIRRYWRMDANPNMPHEQSLQGLYYYYHALAKALRAWGEPLITDADGVSHNWRHELIDALAGRVRDDGSWLNEADRWYEGDPVLVTAYAVLALQEALAD